MHANVLFGKIMMKTATQYRHCHVQIVYARNLIIFTIYQGLSSIIHT